MIKTKHPTALLLIIFWVVLLGTSSYATDWYVRSDGGTPAQCNGQADFPVSNAPNCAFSNWYYLFGNDTTGETMTWKIAGGDKVIIGNTGTTPGQFRVGAKGPGPGSGNSDTWAGCYFYDCHNPPIPAGTQENPTKIYGRNWATSGPKTQLFGDFAVSGVLNLKNTNYVDVRNLEITDHGQCGRIGNSNICSSSFPVDSYANSGVLMNTGTQNISFTDVDVHGIAGYGIFGAIGGNITMTRVKVGFNPAGGWNLDDGTPSTGGTVMATNLTMEWNGCIEQYPITSAVPAFKCFDQSSGGYGDAIGTRDNDAASFIIDQSLFQYNTQDGPDLLHSNTNTLQITRSILRGNMGQQVKLGAVTNTVLRNNLIIHNCNRLSADFPGAPAGYNAGLSNFCRAAGDGLGINFGGTGTQTLIESNTYAGYGATTIDTGCVTSDCSGGVHQIRNNIFYGYANPNYNAGQTPGFIYYGPGITPAMITRTNNIIFNHRNVTCPTGNSGEQCSNPQLQNTPAFVNEATLDALDLTLTATSPAVNAGLSLTGFSNDYAGNLRPTCTPPTLCWDIGAYESSFGSPSFTLTATSLTTTSIRLDWTHDPTNVYLYEVRRCTDSTCSNSTQIGSRHPINDPPNFIDTGLQPNTAYWYQIKAVTVSGNQFSAIANAATQAPGAFPLTTLSLTTSSIRLEWVHDPTNVYLYEVRRCTDSTCNNSTQIGSRHPINDPPNFIDTGLQPNTTYSYQIKAVTVSGNQFSNIASATTQMTGAFPLTALALSPSSTRLEWVNNPSNVYLYEVRRCTDPTCNNDVYLGGRHPINDPPNFIDTGLQPNTVYSYRIKAVTVTGNQFSNFASVPTQATGAFPLTATPLTSSSIRVQWTHNPSNVYLYEVRRCTDATCSNDVYLGGRHPINDPPNFTDTGLQPNTTYWYRIKAVTVTGNQFSNFVGETTLY